MRVLVTGASGFVGGAVIARLARDSQLIIRAAARQPLSALGHEQAIVGSLDADTSWSAALVGVDAVVHAAARVHVMHDRSADPLAEFRRVNVEGTLTLARQAAAAGVRRFVFVSSIKVNGERTAHGRPYRADDAPAPADPYGVSKHEAEVALRELSAVTGMEVTIVRPVLVYGPGVKGNFAALLRLVGRGVPLPFASLKNRRSLVALSNLADLLAVCVTHPGAANQTFLVSDGDDVSTAELLRRVGAALHRPARLLPVPAQLLRLLGRLTRREAQVQRLTEDLQVDIEPTCVALGWRPPVSMAWELERIARASSKPASA